MCKIIYLRIFCFVLSASAWPTYAGTVKQWSGKTSGLEVTVTKTDLVVKDLASKQEVLSLAKLAQREIDRSRPAPGVENASEYYANWSAEPLSLVGNILSLQTSYEGYSGGAHVNHRTIYHAIDLKRFASAVKDAKADSPHPLDSAFAARLDQIFPEEALLSKLKEDSYLKKNLVMTPFKTLTDFLKTGVIEASTCEFLWSPDVLQQFAFSEIRGTQVGIRMGLTHGCEIKRGNLTKIGITMPAPQAIQGQLDGAKSGKTGFLLMSSQKLLPKTDISASFGDD